MLVDTKNLRIRDYLDSVRGSVLSMDDDDIDMDIDGRLAYYLYHISGLTIV